jgi:[acyl-carrier-protein] S-malonyltransferase
MNIKGKVCYVFPGQGSQYVGMGKDIYNKYDFVKELFHTGNKILGYNITDLMFDGSKKELKKTIYCQPAMFLTNLAYFKVLTKIKKIPCSLTLGHSIGEYSALVASGVLSLEDGIKLVKRRAELMTECIPSEQKKHYMAAVLTHNTNLIDLVKEACDTYSLSKDVGKGIVQIANINSPYQIIISGNHNAVTEVSENLKSKNLKIFYLNVEGPFHSELMRPAAEGMEKTFEEFLKNKDIEIKTPKISYIANYTSDLIFKPNKIKESLINQICGTVRWEESLERAIGRGFKNFVECGPKNVQTKILIKDYKNKNYEEINVWNAENIIKF